MLEYLKQKTTAIHKQVEKDNLAKYILDHSISLKQYQDLLEKNYSIYSLIENNLTNCRHLVGKDLLPFINKDKSDKLFKDLKQFNSNYYSQSQSKIDIKNEAELIGALYVIQGSMLGSLLIGKNIAKCKLLKDVKEHHFFNQNFNKETIDHWKAFSEVVNNKTYSKKEKEVASRIAEEVFKMFGNS